MSILSDVDILRAQQDLQNLVEPFSLDRIQPSSYELTLGEGFQFLRDRDDPLDVTDKGEIADSYVSDAPTYENTYYLDPGEFALVTTAETVNIPEDLAARVEGKSSLGRVGLLVHVTAGYIDPGFSGQITLEVVNLSPRVLILPIGMKLAQLCFFELTSPVARAYGHEALGSRYQDQKGIGISKGVDQIEVERAMNEVFNG